MPMQKPSKPGNIMITRIGHTQNDSFGSSPSRNVRGRPTDPSPIVFGGSK